jgi:DNA-directed RNA polymerase specialized sigma subunit
MNYIPLVKASLRESGATFRYTWIWNDLVQAGSLGLIDAARKFDARKKVPFNAYAK